MYVLYGSNSIVLLLLFSQDDRFYQNGTEEDDDDDEDDDDEDDDVTFADRRRRFQKAYQVALSTDTQGYCVASPNQMKTTERTAQELTAISWAAFCTEIFPDATYRIQALDADQLFERLKLASHMLRERKTDLRLLMKDAGLTLKSDNNSDLDGGDSDDKPKL